MSGARVTAVVVFLFSKHTLSMLSAARPGKWGWGTPCQQQEGHLQCTSVSESSSNEIPVAAHHSSLVQGQNSPRGPRHPSPPLQPPCPPPPELFCSAVHIDLILVSHLCQFPTPGPLHMLESLSATTPSSSPLLFFFPPPG